MKINEIIASLRCCGEGGTDGCRACPARNPSADCLDILHREAADTLEAQQKRIEELEAELKDERHRHDRYVDFELAQAKELAQLRAERRWIPVNEPPEEEGWYQVWTKTPWGGYKSVNKARWGNGEWHGSGGRWTNVTHWMPLPEPPKEG